MQLYLTVRPEDTRTASAYPAGLAHAAYRIGRGPPVEPEFTDTGPVRADGPRCRGCWFSVTVPRRPLTAGGTGRGVLRECARRSYGGIVLDFDEPSREDRRRFAPYWGSSAPKAESSSAFPRPTPGRRSIPPLL